MASQVPSSSGLLRSWSSFSSAYKAASPDERLLYTTLMQQLLAEQGQNSQDDLPPQMFDLQRLVVQELRRIVELRNCEKFKAAIDLLNSSLAPQDLWKAHQWVQEGCRESDVAMQTEREAQQLCRELLVIRCCHNAGNMDKDRFRYVMHTASGVQHFDNDSFSKLSLSYRKVVTIGSAGIAQGKHVKLIRDEMSCAFCQAFLPGQKGQVGKLDEARNAIIEFDRLGAHWIPGRYLNGFHLCASNADTIRSGQRVEVHKAFSVDCSSLVVNELMTGTVLLGPRDGNALIQLSPSACPEVSAEPVWLPVDCLQVTDFEKSMKRMFKDQDGSLELWPLYELCSIKSFYTSKQNAKGPRHGKKRQVTVQMHEDSASDSTAASSGASGAPNSAALRWLDGFEEAERTTTVPGYASASASVESKWVHNPLGVAVVPQPLWLDYPRDGTVQIRRQEVAVQSAQIF